MNIEFWLLYCLVVLTASIIPGPSMILALTHGIKYGYKRSLATALGNTSASLLQAIIAISGLNVILTTSQILFDVISYLGAGYLIYIGFLLFKTPVDETLKIEGVSNERESLQKMFNQAFLVAIGNPKAILFFTALFPQFLTQKSTPLLQYVSMTLTLGVIAFVCMMIYSIAGHHARSFFKTSTIGKYLNKITGGLFAGIGCGVILKIAKNTPNE